MADDMDGSDLIDSAGEHVGTIERTYVDDSGVARFVKVKLDGLLPKHRLVPVDQATGQNGSVQVPYTDDTIEESPGVDAGDTLEGEDLDSVRAYYASDLSGTASTVESEQVPTSSGSTASGTSGTASAASSSPDIQTEQAPEGLGAIRDLGDVVEIPVIEEVLIKKPVVREVLRVKKSEVIQHGMAEADIRKESFEVTPSAPGLVRQDGSSNDDSGGS